MSRLSALSRLRYHIFDLLYFDGFDLTGQACSTGNRCSRRSGLPTSSPPLRNSEHSDEDWATMLPHACRMGLEQAGLAGHDDRRASTIIALMDDGPASRWDIRKTYDLAGAEPRL